MLAAHSLSVIRGERLVLSGLSFTLDSGGALVLTGPNGAGKTTLLRVLAGLKPPDAGRVDWTGETAFLGHLDGIKPGLTVAENLRFDATLSGRDPVAALAAFGLDALRTLPARMLSSGQRRRAALARLSLSRAKLWLLDEPTNALDTAAVAQLGAILARHRAEGGFVVAATHLDLALPDATHLALTQVP